ncbi:MAG: TonB-dependent receptor [Caulobacteraceae bacterium]
MQPADPPPQTKKLNEVVVTGVRPLLGDKLPLTVQNTPQTVSLITDKLMADQAITRLEDALKNVPGVTLNAGEGAARGDTVNIRGFSAFNDFFLDGIRDAAVYNRDSFNLASIEVVKGPSATLFGRGSTGGAINQVSKAPGLDPFAITTLDLGTNDEARDTTDIDVPLGPSAAFRFNAMGEYSKLADRRDVTNRRWGVAPAVSFGIGQSTTVTLAYLHQEANDIPDVGVPFLDGAPAPVPRNADFGLSSDRAKTRDDIFTARFKHAVSDSLTLTDTFRYANYWFDYRFVSPSFGTSPPTPGEPLAAILVGRDAPDSFGDQTNLTDQVELAARFATGPIRHILVLGTEAARQTSDINRALNPFNADNAWIPETPLEAPNPNEARPSEPVASIQRTVANTEAAYLIDTMAIGRFVDVIAAARYDRFAADYRQLTVATGAVLPLSHIDNLGSPRLAIVVKPTPDQSYYVSYGTSFDPSAEALALTTKTADLGPVKAKTLEAGAKTRWLDGGLTLTGAVFRTEVDNAQTNDPDNPTLTVLEGDERVDGVEFTASGHLSSKLEIVAGYTYLDGRTIASGVAADVGKAMPNVARNAVNLWAEYRLTDRLEMGVGGNYLGARFADPGNTAVTPAYVVVNAMASYRVSPRVTLQLNVFNLTDKLYYDGVYWTSAAENHVIPGPGRTVKLTARVALW